jgi:hypothetical protein
VAGQGVGHCDGELAGRVGRCRWQGSRAGCRYSARGEGPGGPVPVAGQGVDAGGGAGHGFEPHLLHRFLTFYADLIKLADGLTG